MPRSCDERRRGRDPPDPDRPARLGWIDRSSGRRRARRARRRRPGRGPGDRSQAAAPRGAGPPARPAAVALPGDSGRPPGSTCRPAPSSSAGRTPSSGWRPATTSTSSSSATGGDRQPPAGPRRARGGQGRGDRQQGDAGRRRPPRDAAGPAARAAAVRRHDPADPLASPLAWLRPIDSEHSAIWQCLAGESMDRGRALDPHRLGRPVPRRRRPTARVTPAGPASSDLADGRQDHDRLGHAGEQGPGGHRGALAVRCRLRRDRRGHPPAERRPLGRPVRGRLAEGAARHPGHAPPDPVRPDLPAAARPRRPPPISWRPPGSSSARPTNGAFRRSGSPARPVGSGRAQLRPSSRPTRSPWDRFLAGGLDFPGIARVLEAAVERFGGGADQAPGCRELIALDAEVRATRDPRSGRSADGRSSVERSRSSSSS